jgi:4-amino-4-deoxy-L-arabinose transferase-like glycosyltransferase
MNNPAMLTAASVLISVGVLVLWVYLARKKWQPLKDLAAQIRSAFASVRHPSAGDSSAYRSPSSAAEEPAANVPPGEMERRQLAGALVFVGFCFGVLSFYLRQDLPVEIGAAYLPFLAAGLLFFMGGMYLASRIGQKVFFDPAVEWMSAKSGLRPWQLVCLVSGVLFACLATVAAGTGAMMISPVVAILSWIAGIALTVIGGWDLARRAGRTPLPKDALWWAIGLSAAAFLLRAVLIGQIPVMLTGDEASAGIDALQWRIGAVNNPFGIFGWHQHPSLDFFIESLGIALFGRTTEALRLPSALAGALTVGALYLAVRAMYGHRYGLAAAVFLSALHLHMHFSRLGINNIWDGLWYTITLGALWYGWQSGKRAYWILAGAAMGFGQFFYTTGRTLFIAVPLFLLAASVFDRGGWRRNRRSLLPALAVLAAVLLPLAWYMATHTEQYLAGTNGNTIFGAWLENAVREQNLPAWRILLNQIGLGFGAFFSVDVTFWYRPETPILRTLPAVFFVFGLAILALRLRDMRTWVPLLWLAAYGMVASLSESAPAAQRLAGVGPTCALVVGFGAMEFVSILAGLFPARQWQLGLASILLVGYMAADDLNFYFREYTPQSVYLGRYDFVGTGGEVARRLVEQLNNRPVQWEVVFLTNSLMGYYSDPAIRYLAPNAEGTDINATWGSPDNPPIPYGNLFLVIMPGREEEIPLIQADCPGGTLGEIRASDGSLLYTYYEYRPAV